MKVSQIAIVLSYLAATTFTLVVADSSFHDDVVLKHHIQHGHGPESTLTYDDHIPNHHDGQAAPSIFPSPARHSKSYVERRGFVKSLTKRAAPSDAATGVTSSSTGMAGEATSMTSKLGIPSKYFPAVVAAIAIISLLCVALVFYLIKTCCGGRSKNTGKNVPDGFNAAPRAFHSKAASISTISSKEDKYSSPWSEKSDMATFPSRIAPPPNYSMTHPPTADLGSPSAHQHHTISFDPRSLPPTSLARQFPQYTREEQSPFQHLSPRDKSSPHQQQQPRSPTKESGHAARGSTGSSGSGSSIQRRIPVPVIRSSSSGSRSRSNSQPPQMEKEDYDHPPSDEGEIYSDDEMPKRRPSINALHSRGISEGGDAFKKSKPKGAYSSTIPFMDPRSNSNRGLGPSGLAPSSSEGDWGKGSASRPGFKRGQSARGTPGSTWGELPHSSSSGRF